MGRQDRVRFKKASFINSFPIQRGSLGAAGWPWKSLHASSLTAPTLAQAGLVSKSKLTGEAKIGRRNSYARKPRLVSYLGLCSKARLRSE